MLIKQVNTTKLMNIFDILLQYVLYDVVVLILIKNEAYYNSFSIYKIQF